MREDTTLPTADAGPVDCHVGRLEPERCAVLLATLLQYAKHPATPNSPRWVSFIVPDDFLDEAEAALADAIAPTLSERMSYPKCKDGRNDCQFQNHGGYSTCMYSPIEYDREGKAVGGGMNERSTEVSCSACGRRWAETRTELEAAQGVKPTWIERA